MADAMFLRILDRVVEELNTDRPADVPEVTKRRAIPGQIITEPRMAVFLGDEVVDPPRQNSPNDPLSRRRLPIAVQCAASTDDFEELDEICQPMLIWATSVLGRTRLGGLVHWVRETGTERRPEYLDLAIMTATQVYECSYQTRRNDLTLRT